MAVFQYNVIIIVITAIVVTIIIIIIIRPYSISKNYLIAQQWQ